MKKSNKIIWAFFAIICVGFLAYGCIFILSNNESIKVNKSIDNILKSALKDDKNYREHRDEIADYVNSQMAKNNVNNSVLCKGNYILGVIDYDSDNEAGALEKLEKAQFYYNERMDVEILIDIHYLISNIYLFQERYDESEQEFNKVYDIAKRKERFDLYVSRAIGRSTKMYRMENGSVKALELMERTLKIAKDINYQSMEDVYFRMGGAYWYCNRYVESITMKLEALELAEEKKLHKKIVNILIDIGVDYLYTGNYIESIRYLEEAMNFKLDYEDEDVKIYALINIADAYMRSGNYKQSSEYYDLLEEYISKMSNGPVKEDTTTFMYVNIANLKAKDGNINGALDLLQLAEERYKARDDFKYLDFDIEISKAYGNVYYALDEYDKALKYYNEVELMCKERAITYYDEENSISLYLTYKALGDKDNAIKYLEKNKALESQFKKNQNAQYSEYLLKKFENDKNNKQILALQRRTEKMRIFLVVFGIIIVIVSVFMFIIFRKNKKIRKYNEIFKNLSVTDALTGLPNRRALNEYLTNNWKVYKETQAPISFAMLDIDSFKQYNDHYGHPQGDMVLKRVSQIIKNSCRTMDFVCRYGGEEFIIIMVQASPEDACNIAKKISDFVNKDNIKHEYSEVSDRITVSIGITTMYINPSENYNTYIKKADEALYKAKKSGKNCNYFLE